LPAVKSSDPHFYWEDNPMTNDTQLSEAKSTDARTISAVIYARVSTDEQGRGYSLPTQIEACRKYAIDRGYRVLKEFTDDYTGDSIDRPGLNDLREFVSSHSIEKVIVYCVDRLARKLVFQLLIDNEFEEIGIRMEYVLGQYEDTEEGRLYKQIQASVAEYEKGKIQERCKRGKRGKAQSGHVLCGCRPPYGYIVRSEPHKSWLEIDEKEAKVVRMVFNWYVDGEGGSGPLSIQNIALRLTKMHIPTRGDKVRHVAKKKGNGVWTAGMVRHILLNQTYIGVWHYGKTKMVPDGKK
jgi:site-specific DNA recombinase